MGNTTTLDEAIAHTITRTRDTLSEQALDVSWHYWCRLSWNHRVSLVTANEQVEQFVAALSRTSSGIRFMTGMHFEVAEHVHAHVVVKLARRKRLLFLTPQEFQGWLSCVWAHGQVFVEAFDNDRFHNEHERGGGAIRYLAKHPETVWADVRQAHGR